MLEASPSPQNVPKKPGQETREIFLLNPFSETGSFISDNQKKLNAYNAKHHHETERSANLAADIETKLDSVLADRKNIDALSFRKSLCEAPIITRSNIGSGSNNSVEQVILNSDEKGELITFAKNETGETFYLIDSEQNVFKLSQTVNETGEIEIKRGIITGEYKSQIEKLLIERNKSESKRRFDVAGYYDIPMDSIPVDEDIIGLKYMDRGHAVRSEYVSSVIDILLNLDASQQTSLRIENGTLSSFQLQAPGEALTSNALDNFLENKSKCSGAKSLMRLACLDFLIKQADRHIDNIFYDEKSQKYSGIDNGGANELSVDGEVSLPNGETYKMGMPVDTYISIPLDMVYMDEEWQIDKEALTKMRELYFNILNYIKYINGELSPEESADLPEHVRHGRDAKIISDSYKLLHERLDEDGNPIPETTKIAKHEANEFMKRLAYLITYKRPPKLKKDNHSEQMIPIVKIMLQRYGR
ncbi:MAG: hypothetical protein P1P90_04165 [Patescibacteria group bacterium]|nr:hypothetical protein [Patescibacteria group bacterium]